ncbi:MAG: family 1 glycosylhydrolase [Acidimicrobiales bacterium]
MWGLSSSSVSAQGVAASADWSAWERAERVPRSGEGAGFDQDHRDDLEQFAALGCTDWRLTIEWARIEPLPGRVDTDAVDRYRDICAHARRVGLRTWLTLHHGSLPGWYLDDEGGHRDTGARGRFWARHVDRVAEVFDDLCDGWVPIDDPIGWAIRGYGLGTRPPGRSDPGAMREAIRGAVLAVEEAVRLLASGRQPIMTAWRADTVHAAPLDDGRIAPEARAAATRWDALLWDTWLSAHGEGVLDVEGGGARPVPALHTEVDIVGLVHDHPVGVDAAGRLVPWPARAPRDAGGFAPEPAELAEAVHRAADSLPDHPIALAGHGVATTDDDWRDQLLARSLDHVRDARDHIGLVGYFHDSGIDGYEWTNGFSGPRGLITRDRSVKPSAARFLHAAGS